MSARISGRPTIYQVADEAGVSIATVSRVLRGTAATSQQARAKVLAAAERLGYQARVQPNRAGARRNEAYGLVLPSLGGPDLAELLHGYGVAAGQFNQTIGILVTERCQDAAQAVLELAEGVDGLAIVGASVSDHVAQSIGRKLPVVLVSRHMLPGCDAVSAENIACAQALTTHLVGHGRTHLVFVGDPEAAPDVSERYRGFRLAHAAAGIPIRRPPLRVPFIESAGIQVAEEILRRRVRIDGLVCANDQLAVAVMTRLQDRGVVVPDDIAIIGWDDLMTARYVRPALTTVRPALYEIGRTAASLLHRRVDGASPLTERRVVDSDIVLRSSCGCDSAESAQLLDAGSPASPRPRQRLGTA